MNEVSFLVVLLIVTIGGAAFFHSQSCYAKGKSFEVVSWGPIQGCMVKHKDKMLPLENIRVFD